MCFIRVLYPAVTVYLNYSLGWATWQTATCVILKKMMSIYLGQLYGKVVNVVLVIILHRIRRILLTFHHGSHQPQFWSHMSMMNLPHHSLMLLNLNWSIISSHSYCITSFQSQWWNALNCVGMSIAWSYHRNLHNF